MHANKAPQQMQSQQIKKRERAEFGFVRKQGEENAVANPELGPGAEEIQVVAGPSSVEA